MARYFQIDGKVARAAIAKASLVQSVRRGHLRLMNALEGKVGKNRR